MADKTNNQQGGGDALREDRWLRIKEVPGIVPISIKTVRRRIQEGKLRSTKVGGIRLVRLRDVFDDLLGGAAT